MTLLTTMREIPTAIRAGMLLPALLMLTGVTLPAFAIEHQDHEHEVERISTLVVTGNGSVDVVPDQAVVRFGVVVESTDAADAQEQVNARMAEVIDAISKLDIPEKHLQTTNLSLRPIYKRQNKVSSLGGTDESPQIIGYRANYTLAVTCDEIALAGDVIDEALEAGVNEFQGIQFTLKDDSEARMSALAAAAADAKRKGATISEAMDVGIVGITAIQEGHRVISPRPMLARGVATMAAEAATPVQAGQVTVHATLTVEYEIESHEHDHEHN